MVSSMLSRIHLTTKLPTLCLVEPVLYRVLATTEHATRKFYLYGSGNEIEHKTIFFHNYTVTEQCEFHL